MATTKLKLFEKAEIKKMGAKAHRKEEKMESPKAHRKEAKGYKCGGLVKK